MRLNLWEHKREAASAYLSSLGSRSYCDDGRDTSDFWTYDAEGDASASIEMLFDVPGA